MIPKALKWIDGPDGCLELIDQRKLPGDYATIRCEDTGQLFEAIKTLAVRGAPAIGVAGAYGPVLAMQRMPENLKLAEALKEIKRESQYLVSSRPTAVNLSWALNRVRRKAEEFVTNHPGARLKELQKTVYAEARAIHREDIDMCLSIGRNGREFIKEGSSVLTHCNAGALATAGQGTAVSIVYEAHKEGKEFDVYVDETRPLLQGARLTVWELMQAGIDVTLVCDNMAGWLMNQNKVDAVITGADRIASNGDTANKIGTLSLSILARHYRIPFYVAAPSSTFDVTIKSGAEIPIEQRDCREVISFSGKQVAPDTVRVYNPAFDITEAGDITAIITEKGVIESPSVDKISRHLKIQKADTRE